MLTELRDIVAGIFTVKQPTAEELKRRADAAGAEEAEACRALLHEEESYARATLNGAGLDEIGQARAHKRLVEARARVARIEDRKRVIEAALEERARRDAEAARVAAWDLAAGKIRNVGMLVDEVHATIATLAQQVDAVFTAGEVATTSLPEPIDPVERHAIVWQRDNLMRQIELQLFALGVIRSKSFGQGPWTLSQGPKLPQRFRESMQLALRKRPKHDSELPPAA